MNCLVNSNKGTTFALGFGNDPISYCLTLKPYSMVEKIQRLVSEVMNDKDNNRRHEVELTAEEFAESASAFPAAVWSGSWVEWLERHVIPKNKSSVIFTPMYIVEAYYDDIRNDVVFASPTKTYAVTFEGRELFIYRASGNVGEISLKNDDRDYYHYSHALKGISDRTPNHVGTLTDKKVREWVSWLDERAAAYDAITTAENEEVAKFLAEMLKIDPATCDRCEIGDERGVVEKGGIRLSYRVENRHVHTELGLCKQFTYGLESVAEFNRITMR